MLNAVKENKIYAIDEQAKERYLKEGFDIYENEELIAQSPLKEVKYADYEKLQKELAEVKENVKPSEELVKANEELTKQVEDLTKAKEELESTNIELVKANEKLAKQVEKAKGSAKEE